MAEASAQAKLGAWLWVLVAVVAVGELMIAQAIRAGVPSTRAWDEAAAFVRGRFEPGDRIEASPPWLDPVVRRELGDLLTLRTASAGDQAGVTRVWQIGPSDRTTHLVPPLLDERFGAIRVRLWAVQSDALVFDFVESIQDARVEYDAAGEVRPCPWTERRPRGGGLGHGPLAPAARHVCDPSRPWLWVGATVMADLSLAPRRCIWQHPVGPEPVRTTFDDVPLGDVLVVEGGLDYNNARTDGNSLVALRMFLDDALVGEMEVRDREPWGRFEIDTTAHEATTGRVRVETTTPRPHARTLCWSASTRQRGEAP
ncbi:MAG: hypothetical protein WBG86_03680 [Polyangiales bacterium]